MPIPVQTPPKSSLSPRTLQSCRTRGYRSPGRWFLSCERILGSCSGILLYLKEFLILILWSLTLKFPSLSTEKKSLGNWTRFGEGRSGRWRLLCCGAAKLVGPSWFGTLKWSTPATLPDPPSPWPNYFLWFLVLKSRSSFSSVRFLCYVEFWPISCPLEILSSDFLSTSWYSNICLWTPSAPWISLCEILWTWLSSFSLDWLLGSSSTLILLRLLG